MTIPIVFCGVGDPVSAGAVASLARPGGNATGLGGLAIGVSGKGLALLKQAVPQAQRIGLVINPDFSIHATVRSEVEAVAQRLKLQLRPVVMRSPDDIESTFAALAAERVDAVHMLGQPFFYAHAGRLSTLALANRLPVCTPFEDLTKAGLLMSYGGRQADEIRRLSYYLDRILKGTAPAELPVEQPSRFYLTLNLKTATALELELSQSIRLQADEVIE